MPDNLYFCIMLDCKRHNKMRPFIRRLLGGVAIAAALYSCASVGRIEGGPYDETPPRFISGTPTPGALSITIKINFPLSSTNLSSLTSRMRRL